MLEMVFQFYTRKRQKNTSFKGSRTQRLKGLWNIFEVIWAVIKTNSPNLVSK
jgi:hypothetical protein